MNELDDFIGKFKRLQQAGKEANLVLKTLAGNAWATLSVRIGHWGPGQHTQQQKARGARNDPAQQRRREKRESARATQGGQNATSEAAAPNEDATVKYGHKKKSWKSSWNFLCYAVKVKVSAAVMRIE